MRRLSQTAEELLRDEEQWHQNPTEVWGLPTGYPSWDRITGGLHKSEVTVVGFRTGEGKTAFVMHPVFSVAEYLLDLEEETGIPQGKVLFFSPEMTDKSIISRYVSSRSGVPSRRVRKGLVDPEQREVWRAYVAGMSRYDNVVDLEAGQHIYIEDLSLHLQEASRLYHDEGGIALIVIDYLGLIEGKGNSSYEKTTHVSRQLKQIALRHQVPLIVTSQFKRQDLKPGQAPTRPTTNDLKDSGDIENSADNILIGWRPDRVEGDKTIPGRAATIWVEKQREGPRGHFVIGYHAATTRFKDTGEEVFIDGE